MANQTEKVVIYVGDQEIELTGDDLIAFKADRKLLNDELKAQQSEAEARAAARTSALAKLAD